MGSENVGDNKGGLRAVAVAAFGDLNSRTVRVGAMQCLFEGSMHVFVFLWTPVLQRGGRTVPHGFIFSVYMACMMLGGKLTAGRYRPSLGLVFAIAACCLFMPSIVENLWVNLMAFSCFELCVGCYFPQIAMLRSKYLDEKTRSAVITVFRVPLNCIVVAVLLWGRSFPPHWMLLCASTGLMVGCTAFYSFPKEVEV